MSPEQLAQILSIAPDAIIVVDAEQRIVFFNEGAERIFGYAGSDLIGEPLHRLIPERFREAHALHVGAFAESAVSARRMGERLEIAGLRRGGEEFAAEASILKISANDEPLLAVLLRDVSDRRRAESRLRRSEDEFRLLVEGVRDYAIFMLDATGHIASWNRGAELIKGYRADEIVGKHFSIFYPRDAVESGWPDTELLLAAERGRFEDEGWRVRKDGSRFWANVLITALRGADGELIGYGKVTRDLTERRRAEEEKRRLAAEQAAREALEENAAQLEELTAELEQTVDELQHRTREEAHAREEAESARQAAEDASQAKTQFLAVMSHELRTPLNVVLGFSDLLAAEVAGPLTDGQREHLGRIQASSWHLLDLINRVLSLSRIEAGREDIEIGTVDVAAIGRECARLVEPAALKKQLSLITAVPSAPLTIETDAGKVRQILLNLLNNAVKFTDEGQVELRIGRENDGGIRIDVRDTGIGVAEEYLERIFEPFTQVEPSSSRGRGGTGLGLSVTRRLTRLLGGDVSVTTQPGRGSTFTVHLPADPPDVSDADEFQANDPPWS